METERLPKLDESGLQSINSIDMNTEIILSFEVLRKKVRSHPKLESVQITLHCELYSFSIFDYCMIAFGKFLILVAITGLRYETSSLYHLTVFLKYYQLVEYKIYQSIKYELIWMCYLSARSNFLLSLYLAFALHERINLVFVFNIKERENVINAICQC